MVNISIKQIAKCGVSVYEVGIALNKLQRSIIQFQPEIL